jgi:hypothetical protein
MSRRYSSKLQASIKSLKSYPQSKTALWLKVHHTELKDFTPQRWFFIQQLETLIFFLSQKSLVENSDFFSEQDDLIFERWNSSEFADIFLRFLNKRYSLINASKETSKIFDEHLVCLGNFHLLKIQSSQKNYRLQPSLGDIKKQSVISKLLEITLNLDGKEINLLSSNLKEMKKFSTKIEVASRLIKKFSPDSWERFVAFTEIIIPIKQKELVSYSHQDLPGTSMINLYHRDFVDLLDDLIHENGHHHLNYYLNLEVLIQEPLECIYYSPWRRTLRPLRGIYHAYFTFFWAFKLFSDMASAKEIDSIWYLFSHEEKEKIIWRAVEEYWMLDYAYTDLQWARKQGLISDLGWDLIKEQRAKVFKLRNKISILEKSLKKYKHELRDLKKDLTYARKHYKKS